MSDRPLPSNFDALRLAAALAVLTSHQVVLAGHAEPMLGRFGTLGAAGVLVFFSISGYLVSSSWTSDPHVGRFLVRRFLRIWPAYAVAIVVCAGAVIVANPDPPFGGLAGWFFLHNLHLGIFFDWPFFKSLPQPWLNGSLWTIRYEVACYLVLAAMAWTARRSFRWIALASLIALVAWYAIEGGQTAFDHAVARFSTMPYLAYFGSYFCAGALLYHFPMTRSGLVLLIIIAVAAVCSGQWAVASLAIVPALTVQIGTRSWPILREAGRWGDLSYGTYLWAFPLTQLGLLALGPSTPLAVLLTITLAASLGMAVLSWHLVERPAMRLKPRGPGRARRAPRVALAGDGLANP